MKKLISFDTSNPPGNEAECAKWAASWLESCGFETRLVNHSEKRSSVIASIRKGKGKKIVFNGHLDVVPVGSEWDTNPFEAVEKGSRIYARGAADMKGGVAAMIAAAATMADQPFNGEIMLNLVADEELFNVGTMKTLEFTKDADFVIIGEPTCMELHIAHRGLVHFLIRFEGKSCHGGLPELGVNAIENAALGILALKEYAALLKTRKHPLLPNPTFASTVIQGGEKDNIIPGVCTLRADRRLIPGESPETAEREIRAVLDGLKIAHPEFGYTLENYHSMGSGEISSDAELVKLAGNVYRDCFGEDCKIACFPASCEQTFFTAAGADAVIIGPGSIEQAHVVNEFIEKAEIEKAERFYKAFLKAALH
ncbi:M20 family metallopeptidase [Leadbettera azotonutricia]|uniref:M20 family metallopeptidase n=1 Tax=Leadbettera azotonutricia TaxID=150829 RepID=UPI00145EC243|nr:M20 family metallopeptidase [Leadbettera azotonutricia]